MATVRTALSARNGVAAPTRPTAGEAAARRITAAGGGPPGGRPRPGRSPRSRAPATATRTAQASASRTSAARTTRARRRVPVLPQGTTRDRTSPARTSLARREAGRRRWRASIAGTTVTRWPGWTRHSRISSPRSAAAAPPAAIPIRGWGDPASPVTHGTGRPATAGTSRAAFRRRATERDRAPRARDRGLQARDRGLQAQDRAPRARGRGPCRAARAVTTRIRSRGRALACAVSSPSAR